MKPMPLSLVASVVHGELNAPARECAALFVQGFAVDSRNIGNGDLFVAIEGERVDGHAFVTSAVEAGALAALVSREVEGAPCLIVPDPVAALGQGQRQCGFPAGGRACNQDRALHVGAHVAFFAGFSCWRPVASCNPDNAYI